MKNFHKTSRHEEGKTISQQNKTRKMMHATDYYFIYSCVLILSRFNWKFLYKLNDQELIGQVIYIPRDCAIWVCMCVYKREGPKVYIPFSAITGSWCFLHTE